MIRINLAKSALGAPKMDGIEGIEGVDGDLQALRSQGAIRLVLLFLVPVALYIYESQNIPELRKQLQTKNQLLQQLTQKNEQAKGAVEEIRQFKEDQAKLQQQIDTLDGLQRERLKEVKILDNLQKDIPEKVWLTKITFQENSLLISGVTTSDSELTLLMENLGKSVFLKDVNLVKSSEAAGDKQNVKKFEIVCTVERTLSTKTAEGGQ